MDLLIIRHGQSEADILNVIEGRADFELTELGHRQASQMAAWVKNYIDIDKIYASTLTRARQTAEKLSAALGCPITFDERLMEWNNGLIAGLSRAEADAKYPRAEKQFLHTALYGQESTIEFRARAEAVLSEIINENPPDSRIAVVSHGGMIGHLFRSFLRLPIDTDVGLFSGDTCVHHWKIADMQFHRRNVVFSNSLVHLREDE